MNTNTALLAVALLCVGCYAALDTTCADAAADAADTSQLSDYQLGRFKNESAHIKKYCLKAEGKGSSQFGSYAKCFQSKWKDAQRYKDLPIGVNNAALVGFNKCLACTVKQADKVCGDKVFADLQNMIIVLAEADDVQKQVKNIAKVCRTKANYAYITCSQELFAADVLVWQNHADACSGVVKSLAKCK